MPFVPCQVVDILPPACRHSTPSPFASPVPPRIVSQTLVALCFSHPFFSRRGPQLLASAMAHPISDTLPSHHRPAKASPIAVSWNSESCADTSFRDLGEGIDP